MLLELPQVTFYGQLRHHSGRPASGIGVLRPFTGLRCFAHEDLLISTQKYDVPFDERGNFMIDVLPTDYGVEEPWMYVFETPVNVFRISLPLARGPHNLRRMLERSS